MLVSTSLSISVSSSASTRSDGSFACEVKPETGRHAKTHRLQLLNLLPSSSSKNRSCSSPASRWSLAPHLAEADLVTTWHGSQQPRTFAYLSVGWCGRCPCPIALVRSQQYLTDSSILLCRWEQLLAPYLVRRHWRVGEACILAIPARAGLGWPLLIG